MSKVLTPIEAAQLIGCSVRHVRWLIVQGKVKAHRLVDSTIGAGFTYRIDQASAHAYATKHVPQRGNPRGSKRS